MWRAERAIMGKECQDPNCSNCVAATNGNGERGFLPPRPSATRFLTPHRPHHLPWPRITTCWCLPAGAPAAPAAKHRNARKREKAKAKAKAAAGSAQPEPQSSVSTGRAARDAAAQPSLGEAGSAVPAPAHSQSGSLLGSLGEGGAAAGPPREVQGGHPATWQAAPHGREERGCRWVQGADRLWCDAGMQWGCQARQSAGATPHITARFPAGAAAAAGAAGRAACCTRRPI